MSQQAKLPQIGEVAGFIHAASSFAVAALVTVGFGGTIYKLAAPGGWIAQLFGRSIAGGLAAVLALLLIGASAWTLRASISFARRDLCSELFVYVFAGVGLVYSLQILMKGGF